MNTLKTALALLLVALILSFTISELGERKIEEDYSIEFSTRSAKGTFGNLQGRVLFDPENLDGCLLDVRVDVETINTGNNLKNKHALGKSWFDVENHPHIKFISQSFSMSEGGFVVNGMLELRGIQKEISIPFTLEQENEREIFRGSFSLNRHDYGIKGKGLKAKFVGDEVEVKLMVPTVLL